MLAIIPARGGSKGLPSKNIKVFAGKPLIAYTIEAALQSEYVDDVIVSTDDVQIAEVAVQYGARVPSLRPSHLATDESIAIDTYLYEIDQLEAEKNLKIDELMVLLPTCPLREVSDLNAACDLFRTRKASSVVSYVKEDHPLYWHKVIDEDCRIADIFNDMSLRNRQNYPTTYYPNGAIYIFRTHLLRDRMYYDKDSLAYIMPRERSVDIDTMEDFNYAEYLHLKRIKA